MFTRGPAEPGTMPPILTTIEEKITLKQGWTSKVYVRRLSALTLAAAALAVAIVATPAAALAGQQEVWAAKGWGTEPGEFFNPKQFGVDPEDGSVYIVDGAPGNGSSRIEKFSSTGSFEGTATISRTAEEPGATGKKGFIGIAVNPTAHRFYMVQDEAGLAGERVATKVLAFSTELSSPGNLGQPVATFPLPAADSPNVILSPQELAIDPSNGELVISGKNPDGNVIFQRISSTGSEEGRFTDTAAKFEGLSEKGDYGYTVAPDGVTYILVQAPPSGGSSDRGPVEGFTLPAGFGSASTLSPIPGFQSAGETEEWRNIGFALAVDGAPSGSGHGTGPQIAVVKASDGEETLFWKASENQSTASREEVWIHGFSLQQEATTVAYGGADTVAECEIQSSTAALAPTKEGGLAVLEQGQFVEDTSSLPEWGPHIYRFGPGGTVCPASVPVAKLKVGATEVTAVTAGEPVKLDATGSEIGSAPIEEVVWSIEKPDGQVEKIEVMGPSPALETSHAFAEPGDYNIRVAFKAPLGLVGSFVSSTSKELTVDPAPPPTIASISPTMGSASGGTTVTIVGGHLAGVTGVKFGSTPATSFAEVGDTGTEMTAVAPAGTAGTKAAVMVTTVGGSVSSTAEFEWIVIPAPVITKVEPTKGPAVGGTTVKIIGEHLTGTTEVKLGTATATSVTVVSDTEVTAVAPAGTAGTKAKVTVTTGGGSVASTGEFEWEAPLPVVKHKLAITLSGSGTVLCDGGACAAEYAEGSEVTLTAVPGAGSTFAGWAGGGCSGTAACRVSIGHDDVAITAKFEATPSNNNNPGGGNTSPPPGGGATTPPPPPPPGGGGTKKTPAQLLKEKRQKAIAKCKKLNGKAEAKCLRKARQIGKPKVKKKMARELAIGFNWDAR